MGEIFNYNINQPLLMTICLKIIVFVTLGIYFISCKNETEAQNKKLQNDLQTYFKASLMDSTSTLDTFRLIQIDTITQRMLLLEQSSVLRNQLDYLIDFYKLSNQDLSLSVDQMQLYSMLGSRDLVKIEKNNFDKKNEKGKQIRDEIDTLMSITKVIDSSAIKADTTKPVGFQAKCFYQLRRTNKSVERDTTFILLNLHGDIVNRSDFLKLPYNIDFDKLR